MNPKEEARFFKGKNIIDMALTFTTMLRLFESDSKQKIAEQLENSLSQLPSISSKDQFEKLHADFCNWFVANVKTARKGDSASYGQAAKVFDVVAKVYVYYCRLPSCEAAAVLLPFLHGAIDTPIMKDLQLEYPEVGINSEMIKSVEKEEYRVLQSLVVRSIQEKFKGQIFPVQYDDIMWNYFNRGAVI